MKIHEMQAGGQVPPAPRSRKLPVLLPVLPQDLSSLSRALLAHSAEKRQALCQELFDRAALAAAHVAHTGTLHPQWGNGSLDAVARRCCCLATEPFWDDPCYINCLMISLQELQRRLPPAQRQQD